MDQISKITNVVKPDLKLFVGDSLAGNDTVSQAREFYEHTKFDGSILTKSDADARGGAALSIVKITSTPILYVGIGQEYDDLKEFNKDTFLETVFGTVEKTQVTQEIPQPESIPEPQLDVKPQKELTIEESEPETGTDPFEGIDTQDIDKYADWYDQAPPENDVQARELAKKIRKWISAGRPKP